MKRRIDSLWTLLGSTLFGVGVVCLLLKAVLPKPFFSCPLVIAVFLAARSRWLCRL